MIATATYSKKLNAALWIAQAALTTVFMISGMVRIVIPVEDISSILPWDSLAPLPLIRIIGLCEVLGAAAILLPPLLEYKAVICAWAASGLAAIMLDAILFHLLLGQVDAVVVNLILASVAIFIAWGRLDKIPFRKTVLLSQLKKS